MERESFDFLKELMEVPSPSGFEKPAQKLVRQRMERYADEVKTDVMGNVMGVKNPGGKPRLMLAGHCDEVGLMVKFITEEGFVYFSPIGGVDPHILPGQRVYIQGKRGPVLGVMGRKAVHQLEEEEKKKVIKLEEQWIDIGVKDKKEAEELISIGDPITFAQGLERLQGDLVVSRGFDDKMGTFLVAETLRLLHKEKIEAAVFFVSTVQEEIGLRGARTSTFGIDPQVGIAVEVGHATDFPGMRKEKLGEFKLGKGPILCRGANINPRVGGLLEEVAKKSKIPYQIEGIPGGTGTDANVMQLTREGVATALVGVPLRYMHTPVEILSLKDLENTAGLLAAFCRELKPGMSFIP